MSTNFEPMSGDALTTWASGNPCAPTNLAQTALHHLARAKAAEEARDLAIAERDEARKQQDRFIVRQILGVLPGADDRRRLVWAWTRVCEGGPRSAFDELLVEVFGDGW